MTAQIIRGAPQGHLLRGAGGGGGKGGGGGSARVAVESPDSLRSQQFAQVLDMVSEGEIEGLVGGLRGVYLDDTPIENSDGTRNFSGVTIDSRTGTQAQTYLPGFPSVENEVAVSTEVTFAASVVRQISNPNINAVRVTVSIPHLTYQNPTNGDLSGTSVTIGIEVQNDGGGWQDAKLRTESVAMAVAGLTANSAAADILSADIGIAWVGEASGATQYAYWRADYRLQGSADPWVQFGSGVFSGAAAVAADPAYWAGSENTYYKSVVNGDGTTDNVAVSYEEYLAATTAMAAPGGSAMTTISLPAEAAYEFQVVLTSGVGTLSISSASAYKWTGTDTISGKTTSKYQRAYRIPLTGTGPWDIRMRRLTADSTTQTVQNATWFESYTEIIDAKLRYPNSAIVGVRVDSSQFRTIPRRGYHIRGLRVRVPSNYDPITRAYAGVWDGTFAVAWTNNPAWCFYDLVTSERYGLGAFIDADQIDKWALYDIAQYCDEMVPDGFGGEEPRFTCNLYLQTRQEAYTVISTMASIFRGLAWWASGSITAHADKPSDAEMLFTSANVVDGIFNYAGSSIKARHTVALVSWNDPADHYRQKIEYVEDAAGIALYGVVETEVLAAGCTSRGQAHRLGRWMLYSERLETETVSFRAGMDGIYLGPGSVIQTQDAARAGQRFGGRVVSATTTAITLDAAVTIEAGQTYTLSAILPAGTLETRAVGNAPGSASVLTVAAFTTAPQAGAIWVLAATNLLPETWRVVGMVEVERGVLEITALAHRADKYDAVEQNLILEPLPTSSYSTNPDPVIGLVATESLYLVTPSVVGNRATLSWSGSQPYYSVTWQRSGDNLQSRDVTVPTCSIDGIEPGVYTFSVVAVNAIGRRSAATAIVQEIYGKTAPPGNVENFALAAIAGAAHLTWNPAADLDVVVGGILRMRHAAAGQTAEWSNGIDIGPAIPGSASSVVLPLLAGTYMAKWVDSSGYESTAAALITTDAPGVLAGNAVATVTEHDAFAGVKTAMAVAEFSSSPSGTALMLDSALTIDEMTDPIDTWPYIGALGGVAESGIYEFDGTVDLGAVFTSRLTAAIEAYGFDASDLIDSRGSVDAWSSVDGGNITDATVQLQVRTTNDNPAGSPAWSAWQPFVTGDWTARAFEFRLLASRVEQTHNVAVAALSVTVDMPDRLYSDNDIACASGGMTVTFPAAFYAVPAVGITAQGMATGDYYTISKTDADFDIQFFNAGGSGVARTFDYIARGY
jgi:predicted phage tail protein